MNVNFVNFDPASADDRAWAAFFGHVYPIYLEVDPEDPLLPPEKRKALIISSDANPDSRTYRFLAFPEGRSGAAGFVAATVETSHCPTYDANKHFAHLSLSVSKEYRRQGLGARLLRHIAQELAAREPAVLEPAWHFLASRGGIVSLERAENRLYLKDADWAMIAAWAEEGARRNPGTAVRTVPVIPQEDLEEYAAVYTETVNQQPFGDIHMDIKITPEKIRFSEGKVVEQGFEQTTMYTKESDGRISGLTEIFYLKEAGYKVTQNLTGVRSQYRGRGLGKLLKARMLLHLKKAYPDVKYVATGNADSNAPMLAINNKLGFKKHLPVRMYKLKLADLPPAKKGEGTLFTI